MIEVARFIATRHWVFKAWCRSGAIRWYPHRELLTSINPNGIAPNEWGFHGPRGSGMVNVPIWHWHPAADFIQAYMPLHGYSGQAAGEFKT